VSWGVQVMRVTNLKEIFGWCRLYKSAW